MRLSVPTNWQKDLIKKIKRQDVDIIIYGKLDRDFIGGGRPSCVIKKISKKEAELHINALHREGFTFYYLLNASCLGNKEWTRKGQKNLNKLLDWLSEIKVDGVVIANPYLAQHLKNMYPHFKISVSSFANVNSVEKTKFWEDLGVSDITLSQVELNRDFLLLEKIRKNIRCELQLIVNDNCLQFCPLFFYHNNAVSHASEYSTPLGSFIFDYCRLLCRYMMLSDSINFIRAAWIRPEDLSAYENIGIDRFKLVDRTMDTDALSLIVEAYSNRSYKGNLYDLFTDPSRSLWLKNSSFFHKWKYFFHPFTVNIFKLLQRKSVISKLEVYIDNKKLNGFINHFLNKNCRYCDCRDCGYCRRVAEEVIKIDSEYRKKILSEYRRVLDDIISGEIFRY